MHQARVYGIMTTKKNTKSKIEKLKLKLIIVFINFKIIFNSFPFLNLSVAINQFPVTAKKKNYLPLLTIFILQNKLIIAL